MFLNLVGEGGFVGQVSGFGLFLKLRWWGRWLDGDSWRFGWRGRSLANFEVWWRGLWRRGDLWGRRRYCDVGRFGRRGRSLRLLIDF